MSVIAPWDDDPMQQPGVITHEPNQLGGGGSSSSGYPAMPAPNFSQMMDPRRQMWAGMLMDIGQHFLSGRRAPMRGWGLQQFNVAHKFNQNQRDKQYAYELKRWETGRPDWKVFGGEKSGYYSYDPNNPNLTVEQIVPPAGADPDDAILAVSPKDATFESLQKFNEHLAATGERDYGLLERVNPWDIQKNADGTVIAFNKQNPGMPGVILRTPEEVADFESRIEDQNTAAEFMRAYAGNYDQAYSAIEEYRALREELAQYDDTGLTAPLRAKFNARLQVLQAKLNASALGNIALLAEKGVKLNPITVEELKLLLSTDLQLSNRQAANLEILDGKIATLEGTLNKLDDRRDYLKGGGRWSAYDGYYQRQEAVRNQNRPGTMFRSSYDPDGERIHINDLMKAAEEEGIPIEEYMTKYGFDIAE